MSLERGHRADRLRQRAVAVEVEAGRPLPPELPVDAPQVRGVIVVPEAVDDRVPGTLGAVVSTVVPLRVIAALLLADWFPAMSSRART